jgi:hypothetical protein
VAQHLYLPALVPYEQVDAPSSRRRDRAVVYRKSDGGEWRDGAAG